MAGAIVILFTVVIVPCLTKPLQEDVVSGQKPFLALPDDDKYGVPELFEGDMVLTPQQRKAIGSAIQRPHPRTRTLIAEGRPYWPKKIIPYDIDSSVGIFINLNLQKAISSWHRQTCVRFQRRSEALSASLGHQDYVRVYQKSSGCSANVGYLGNGQQSINISLECNTGRVIHELGHAIGFIHEQSRPDRDRYVHINKGNIDPTKLRQFAVYPRREVRYFGLPYDIGSIMHYSSTAFSIDQHSPTITADDVYVQPWMGQRKNLSFLDAKLTNLAYQCNEHCANILSCNNEGYQGPNCVCVCPPGLGGPRCDDVLVTSSGCGGILTASDGIITSPNFNSNLPYNDAEECSWMIKTSSPRTVRLTFETFDVDKDRNCEGDYLEVKVHGFSTVGQKYCGQIQSGYQIVHTSSQALLLRFVTDLFGTRPGFRIHYTVQ